MLMSTGRSWPVCDDRVMNSSLSDPGKVLDIVLNTSPRLCLGIGRRSCDQQENESVAFEFVSEMHPGLVSKHAGFPLNDVEHHVVSTLLTLPATVERMDYPYH
jgi:hypothetical protein